MLLQVRLLKDVDFARLAITLEFFYDGIDGCPFLRPINVPKELQSINGTASICTLISVFPAFFKSSPFPSPEPLIYKIPVRFSSHDASASDPKLHPSPYHQFESPPLSSMNHSICSNMSCWLLIASAAQTQPVSKKSKAVNLGRSTSDEPPHGYPVCK